MRVHVFRRIGRNKHAIPGLMWILLTILFIIVIVYQPAIVFKSSLEGLKVWWEIVLPSLLPFFVASEILIKLGFVHFIGILLEPVMRFFFNVPGSGGFVLVMGLVGGAPINGLLTTQLLKKRLCTKSEAERLLCFTNFATPLFMISAVAVGMLKHPELGLIIAGTHYLANIIIGLVLRFYRRNEIGTGYRSNSLSIKNAFVTMISYQRQQKITVSTLLNDAVTASVLKLLNIGGFIILFSVIIHLFTQSGLLDLIAAGFALLMIPLGFSKEIMPAIASGLFETTIGSIIASEATVEELQKIIAIGLMLGWSGLSVHAQVSSMVAKTEINLRLFFMARIAQAFLVAGLTWLVYSPDRLNILFALPAFTTSSPLYACPAYRIILHSFFLVPCLLLILAFLSIIFHCSLQVVRSVRFWGSRHL